MRSGGWFGIRGLLVVAVALALAASVLALRGTPAPATPVAAANRPVAPSPAAAAAPAAPAAPAGSGTSAGSGGSAGSGASAGSAPPAASSAAASSSASRVAPRTAAQQNAAAPPPPGPSATRAVTPTTPAGRPPVFVTYYLWWTANHWKDRLGSAYPGGRAPAPLPATLDASGCGARSLYAGNNLTDVATSAGYDQNDPAVIERDVRLAASLGVTGFAVNWNGAGSASQGPTSTVDNRKLQSVVDAVHKVNAQGIPFRLVLSYKASAVKLSTAAIAGDLSYFVSRYGSDKAMDHSYSTRPEIVWAGSWKYSPAELSTVSGAFRSKLFLIGDEKPGTWTTSRAAVLDGASYYWSSQDPWGNPASFGQIRSLADAVHRGTNPDGRPKTWLAPFTPGYNAQLLYGSSTCVPRQSGKTMHALFQGNKASNPDGWTFISWNEISEGSYIVPLSRYGQQYTDDLKSVIANNG